MPVFDIDLEKVGVQDGIHIATVNKVEFQYLSGEKWNQDGTTTVNSWEELQEFPQDKCRIHLNIALAGMGNMFHDLYLKNSALGFVKDFVQACRLPLKPFNPSELLGKQFMVTVGTKDDPQFGLQQRITKVSKA